ncbi:sigma 54 modulation protein ribosomal protein s30ea : Uncharacterized protein OS=Reinekea blandensis MED297 GN=MED297_06479 PE=4 SV=1: Ribosomal_S30AE [Gemmataceae bacterium]|nr:sigma 54 modulation protein ribosomal protein s30ea : Uncharacterized protein OS=Reinekea blandensis MED297 GN=MED297_06479 PE=4 SV=1: Ribosomal_S30AE [Gemmataceae bacterium]VTU00284.1 sigma 54 modulation protein ribosomal protein s30ea : Uncharacterized protein OS=Reinekea blandensis MED297 GN=MED297_06479 PE=4 SV=1: Ribosomal_S30AE [Gemmataceae bacterium]
MEIDVRTNGVAATPALRDLVYDRVAAALAHATGQIHSVLVVVADVNGPKGGVDKVCRIVAHANNRRVFVAEFRHSSACVAVNGAADRLRSALDRHLGRSLRDGRGDPNSSINRVRALFGRTATSEP